MAARDRGTRKLGDFLNETFSLLPRIWGTVIPLSLAAIGPGALLLALSFSSMGSWVRELAALSGSASSEDPSKVLAGLGPFVALCCLASILLFLGQSYQKAFVCLASKSALEKRRMRLGELARLSFRPAFPRLVVQDLAIGAIEQSLAFAAAMAVFMPLFLAKLGAIASLKDGAAPPASLVAVLVAAYLAAILAAAAAAWWLRVKTAAAAPATVLEGRNSIAGIGRSLDLVRGHGWRVFGTMFIVSLVISFGLGILTGPLTFMTFLPGYFSLAREGLSGAKPSMEAIERLLSSLSWTVGLSVLLDGLVEGTLWPAFLTLLHADLSGREEKLIALKRAEALMKRSARSKRRGPAGSYLHGHPVGIAERLSRKLALRTYAPSEGTEPGGED